MSPVHILQHLSFVCMWGTQWCASPVVIYMVMVDDITYEGLSQVGNLRTSTLLGQIPSLAALD